MSDDEIIFLRKQIEAHEKRAGALDRACKAAEKTGAELERAETEFALRHTELINWYKRRPTKKKKQGRPTFWRGPDGRTFVCDVEAVRRKERCTIATAVEKVVKRRKAMRHPSAARLGALTPRRRQAQFQKALAYWDEDLKPYKHGFEKGVRYRRWDAARTALDRAIERHTSALSEWKRILEGL